MPNNDQIVMIGGTTASSQTLSRTSGGSLGKKLNWGSVSVSICPCDIKGFGDLLLNLNRQNMVVVMSSSWRSS